MQSKEQTAIISNRKANTRKGCILSNLIENGEKRGK